jgi:hypothetical protein
MELPTLLYGQQTDVRKRCQSLVKQLGRGERYLDLMGSTRSADSLSGNLVVVGGSGRGSLPGVHLHCYRITYDVLGAVVAGKLSEQVEEEVMQASLASAWGVTTLLGGSMRLMLRREWASAFLRAVRAYWDELIAVGPRYAYFTLPATELWLLPTSIQEALGTVGVPFERLQGGLTRAGLLPFDDYLQTI